MKKITCASIFCLLLIYPLITHSSGRTYSDTFIAKLIKTDNCLLSYQPKLDQLLPLDIIKKYFKGDLANSRFKYVPSKTGKYDRDKFTYSWPSDRKMTIGGASYPKSNEIGLMWVKVIDFYSEKEAPLVTFKRLYRNPTEEEKQKGFKTAEVELTKKGVSQKDTKNTTYIAKALAAKTKYLAIPAIGDAAVWEYSSNYLIVLSGKVTFRVIVDVDNNANDNIALAKNLALEILKKCK